MKASEVDFSKWNSKEIGYSDSHATGNQWQTW